MVGGLITLLIYVIIVGAIVWLALYVIQTIPLPEPFNRIATVLVYVVAVIIVILLLLQLVGTVNTGLPRIGLRNAMEILNA